VRDPLLLYLCCTSPASALPQTMHRTALSNMLALQAPWVMYVCAVCAGVSGMWALKVVAWTRLCPCWPSQGVPCMLSSTL
jgi:uncharacterized membrane protein